MHMECVDLNLMLNLFPEFLLKFESVILGKLFVM